MSEELLNLVPAIKAIQQEIKKLQEECNRKMKPFQDSLDKLRDINEACESCNGIGKVLRQRVCAEDDRPDPNNPQDYIKCEICNGTGKVRKD